MHEATISGKVDLPWVKIGKGEFTTATRKSLDVSFNEKKIEKITDKGIQKILLNYLKIKGGNPEIAFTQEGIEEMNKDIMIYNDGKKHQPILKLRIYEKGQSRFPLANEGLKNIKFVQGAPNLFFAIYKDDDGKRNYITIPFNEVVENQKQSAALKQKPESVPLKNKKGDDLLFHLSPNDLVYVPTVDEIENTTLVDFDNLKKEQVDRIYKCVSFSGSQAFFVRNSISITIVNKMEYSALNKMENSIEGIQIKSCCWKLEINRIGEIKNNKK